jgi:hypothetical protein
MAVWGRLGTCGRLSIGLPNSGGNQPSRRIPLLVVLLPMVALGVIVDRVAIAVGDKIITESEIDLRIRLTAFQNEEKADFSLASRRRAAGQLIDQRLIEREMDLGHYPRLDPGARGALLANYEKTENQLADYGLTPQDLADDLGRQSDLLTFLNLRFRPAVLVTDEDIQKYFTENLSKGSLNELRAQIEKKLTDERAGKELDLWLQDQHRRTKIEYLEKDLEGK